MGSGQRSVRAQTNLARPRQCVVAAISMNRVRVTTRNQNGCLQVPLCLPRFPMKLQWLCVHDYDYKKVVESSGAKEAHLTIVLKQKGRFLNLL